MVEFRTDGSGRSAQIEALFAETFADSEGQEEGAVIGALVRDILATTPASDVVHCMAWQGDVLVGCILFTPLIFAHDARKVMLLSPVAVAPDHQGAGVGQALLRFGLDHLRAKGVDVVVTYGDPNYYGKVGFKQVTVDKVAAPMPLSQPEGWLAQALVGDVALKGQCTCVAAFNTPEVW